MSFFLSRLALSLLLSGLAMCVQASESTAAQPMVDHYRWMEHDPQRTTAWLLKQSDASCRVLDGLPWRNALRAERESFNDQHGALVALRVVGERRFYLRTSPDFPYYRLFVSDAAGHERLLLDPPVGSGIKFFAPSPDGHWLAYGIGANDSEMASIRLLDIDRQVELPDLIPNARNPHIVWQPGQSAFFYTRLPASASRAPEAERLAGAEVYRHEVGQPYRTDPVIFSNAMVGGRAAGRYEQLSVDAAANSPWLIASSSPSTSGYSGTLYTLPAQALKGPRSAWHLLLDRQQQVAQFVLSGNGLYLARYNATSGYRITRLALDHPAMPEVPLFEWSNGELTWFKTSSDALYLVYHSAGKAHLVKIPFAAVKQSQSMTLPFTGEVTHLVTSQQQRSIWVTLESWTQPPRIYRVDPDTLRLEDTQLIAPPAYDLPDYEVEEIEVNARDQVHVPLTLIHRRGLRLEHNTPTWLSTYGAYGISAFADFDTSRLSWLRRGGMIAIAHVRGGGELGPAWHAAGRGPAKINAVNDLLDCADYLVTQGYTRPHKLVVSGQSAGGAVVGMAVALRPELFAAAAIDAGMLNMTRLAHIPIGRMNAAEFGSAATPQGRANLRRLDAYAHLQEGVRYPALLISVGLRDERVSPWQSAKFAARLKAIADGVVNARPVLVAVYPQSGHTLDTWLDRMGFFIQHTRDDTDASVPAEQAE